MPVVGADRDLIVDRLRRDLDRLKAEYARAVPFPHVVLDDIVPADLYAAAVDEFPAVDDRWWSGYLHFNERKYANVRFETWGPALREVTEALWSDEFVGLLGQLTGFEGLIPDRTMDGGGLHQTLRGGFLNVHTDFTTNHQVPTWRRCVNLLLYLNPTWCTDWGGSLELWDPAVTTCVRSIEPRGNRIVIFTTGERAFHGHPEALRCPAGAARRSLALYYFIEESDPRRQSTRYRSRPGDGLKRVGIWFDRNAIGAYDVVKTRLGLSDRLASDVLRRVHRAVTRVRGAR